MQAMTTPPVPTSRTSASPSWRLAYRKKMDALASQSPVDHQSGKWKKMSVSKAGENSFRVVAKSPLGANSPGKVSERRDGHGRCPHSAQPATDTPKRHSHGMAPPRLTTEDRIVQYQLSVDADPASTVRPTEAQLRWAHFHRSSRAKKTRLAVEALMQCPVSELQVKGAQVGDADSSSEDSSGSESDSQCSERLLNVDKGEGSIPVEEKIGGSKEHFKGASPRGNPKSKVAEHIHRFQQLENAGSSSSRGSPRAPRSPRIASPQTKCAQPATQLRKRRKKKKAKIPISRGRRALLRVSARATKERRENILRDGFAGIATGDEAPPYQPDDRGEAVVDALGDTDDMTVFSAATTASTRTSRMPYRGRELRGAAEDSVRSRRAIRSRPTQKSRRYLGADDEERVKRFEHAFRTMMASADRNPHEPELPQASRRWTRNPNVQSAVSVDGREYQDLQRAGSIRHGSPGPSPNGGTELQDRGATWMEHLPRAERSAQTSSRSASPGLPDATAQLKHYDPSAADSPGQQKLDELVSILQQRAQENPQSPPLHDFDQPPPFLGACVEENSPDVVFPKAVRPDGTKEINSALETTDSNPTQIVSLREPCSGRFPGESLKPDDTNGSKSLREGCLHVVASKREPNEGDRLILAALEEVVVPVDPNENEQPRHSNADAPEAPETKESRVCPPGVEGQCDERGALSVGKEEGSRSKLDAQDPIVTYADREVEINSPQTSLEKPGDGSHLTEQEEGNLEDVSGAGVELRHAASSNEAMDKRPEKCKTGTLESLKVDDMSTKPKSRFARVGAGVKGLRKMLRRGPKGDGKGNDITQESPASETQLDEFVDHTTLDSTDELDKVNSTEDTGETVRDTETESDDEAEKDDSMSLSSEQQKLVSEMVMRNAALNSPMDTPVIDTDEVGSDVSSDGGNDSMQRVGKLMLSPTILTMRLNQAIQTIENRNWDQALCLLTANPWLAEMADVRTDQYLLHKLAMNGAGRNPVDEKVEEQNPAPEALNLELFQKFPGAVHKFDQEGNLPLHFAAASGNLAMIARLGGEFPGGASVRSNEGKLPLHLGVLSCGRNGQMTAPATVLNEILRLFPGGVGVTDNDGNLPLHLAAQSLRGDVGVDVVRVLLDEEEKQLGDLRLPSESRIVIKMGGEENEEDSTITEGTAPQTESSPEVTEGSDSAVEHSQTSCNLVKNKAGKTPLVVAIQGKAGWQIVDAIVRGSGGAQAALGRDSNMHNALHLLLDKAYSDPACALSLLKTIPEIAGLRDGQGMLPVEIACMNSLPREVILGLVLVDLPIDIHMKAEAVLRDGYGSSWWFLNCECDDAHVDIVREVLSICTYQQARELCFMRGGLRYSSTSLISRATPKCKLELRKSLRFVGRYEFSGSAPIHSAKTIGLQVFEGLDFGAEDVHSQGVPVYLRCFGSEEPYRNEASLFDEVQFNSSYVEAVHHFNVHDFAAYAAANAPRQFCVAVERPSLTLARIVGEMPPREAYLQNSDQLLRYLNKVGGVLRLIGKGLRHCHDLGIVHGNVCLQNCGKFEDKWKLMGLIGACAIGEEIPGTRMGEYAPPEAVLVVDGIQSKSHYTPKASLRNSIVASAALDIWAFGKLMYEVLAGESLLPFDRNSRAGSDVRALTKLARWDEDNLHRIALRLEECGVGEIAADLVTHCLCPSPEDRPATMSEILKHPFWKQARKKKRAYRGVSRSPPPGKI